MKHFVCTLFIDVKMFQDAELVFVCVFVFVLVECIFFRTLPIFLLLSFLSSSLHAWVLVEETITPNGTDIRQPDDDHCGEDDDDGPGSSKF